MAGPKLSAADLSGGEGEVIDESAAREAAQVFQLILKGLKNIGIYRHAQSRYTEYLEPAFQVLTQFLEREHIMPLKLGPYTLEYKKQVIYEEESKENLTYKFYRDGMRFMIFREGIEIDEMLRFFLLTLDAQTEAALFHEDMITRLWKENFTGIEYVVVEGFEFGDIAPEEVEIEVEKIVSYLRNQLAANSNDVTRFARLDIEDLALQLNDIDQVRGGIISGRPAKDDDRQWVQDEIYQEEKKRLFAKMVLILFQILERDATEADFASMSESFSQILDSLLVSEDVKGAVAVLHRFEKISQKVELTREHQAMVRRIRDAFAKRMAEPERLQSVAQYLTLAKNLDELAVKAYFSVCSADHIPFLLEMLEGMERVEGRRVLIDVLAELGRQTPGVFAERLTHRSSNVVKDMLAIIDRIDPPNKLDLYAKCLEHQNPMIRLEAIKVMMRAPGDRAVKYLEKAMDDSDVQLRVQAMRALAVRSASRAVPALRKLIRGDDFLSRDKREQIAVVVALGEARTPEALEALSSVFETKGNLFSRGKNADLKLMAIRGLLAARTVEAFKVLAREVQNKSNSQDVLKAAHQAAARLKAELTGQPYQEEADSDG